MRIERLRPSLPAKPGPGRALLVAVDLSSASEAVFEAAIDLAHAEPDATIHLVHVRRPSDPAPAAGAGDALAEWTARLPDDGARIELHALEANDVAEALVRAAARLSVDLVLVGTHGRTGVSRVLLGSIAETVVRTAGCSVLVVRRKRGG